MACSDRFIEFTLCLRIHLMLREGKLSAYAASVHGKYKFLSSIFLIKHTISSIAWAILDPHTIQWLKAAGISINTYCITSNFYMSIILIVILINSRENTCQYFFYCKDSLHELSIVSRMTLQQWSHVTSVDLYLSLVMSECGPKQRELTLVS